MNFCWQLAFEHQNVYDGTLKRYDVDQQAVVQGLCCKSLRVTAPEKLLGALVEARAMAQALFMAARSGITRRWCGRWRRW